MKLDALGSLKKYPFASLLFVFGCAGFIILVTIRQTLMIGPAAFPFLMSMIVSWVYLMNRGDVE